MPNDDFTRFETQRQWHVWLEKNGERSEGLWLELAKKGASFGTVTYAEAVETALCWGWIDGQKGSIDEHRWKQRFTPRRPKSIWSAINVAKAEALIAAGKMQARGLREVERAKADGRWKAAYASPKNATVPDDLAAALKKVPKAKAFFERLDAANRFAILFRVTTAKKVEIRTRRIEGFVKDLAKGVVPFPDRLKK